MITLEEYKAFAEIKSPNLDLKLTPIIDMVNEVTPLYCGRQFYPENEIAPEERCTNNAGDVLLRNMPVSSITLLEQKLGSGWVEVPASEYELDSESGTIILYNPKINDELYGLRATYTYGSGIPAALKQACFELVSYYQKREFIASKSLGNGQQIDLNSAEVFPQQFRNIADLYRVI